MPDIHKLALDYRLPEHFAEEFDGCLTLRSFLIELSRRVIIQDEGFSGKRPFGNSNWQRFVSDTLVEVGLIDSEDEYDQFILDVLAVMER